MTGLPLTPVLCILLAAAAWPQSTPVFETDVYQFGLLKKGPRWTADNTPEVQKIQEGHMANLGRMARLGKLVAAGPLLDGGEIRGVLIFKAESVAEAHSLASEDPAVAAGRLAVEIWPWHGTKGIGAALAAQMRNGSEPKYTMTKYVLALFRKGPAWTGDSSPKFDEMQGAHLQYIRRMSGEKIFLAAGPVTNGEIRGVAVVAAESPAQASAFVEADPAVRAGHFAFDLHPWLVAKEVWP
jgi:uncharacterized protein YciI